MSYETQTASDLRVGLLTFLSICVLAAGIVLAGGDKGLLFKKTAHVKARMHDVGGLKKGAAVTMGGMVVGKVVDICFCPSPDGRIELDLSIRQDMRGHIKADSIPVIKTQGMLGDRYVEIQAGSKEAPVLDADKPLVGKSAADFDEALREANTTLSETNKALGAINRQEGTVGQFLYNKDFYSKLTELETEIQDLIRDFKKQPRKYIKFSVF